jgi:hypothetical protein
LFVLGDLSESEYRSERDRLKVKLTSLTPPEMPDLRIAAELLQDFGAIWDAATPKEKKQIVHTLVAAVYLDSGEHGPLVAVEPKAQFAALFGVMEDSDVEGSQLLNGVRFLTLGEGLDGLLT